MTDVYERLAAHLDTTPAGYPRTASGVEIRILRRLFTEDEAELALHLTVIAEEPRVVARRARRPVADTARVLQEMERKGLILPEIRHGVTRYMVLQFVVGFWEAQVDKLTPDLARDFEEYLPSLFDAEAWSRTRQMRIVPVNTSIDERGAVLPHELVEELVRRGHGHYAVSNCICRQERRLGGEGCDRPMESCLSLGSGSRLRYAFRPRPWDPARRGDRDLAAGGRGRPRPPGGQRATGGLHLHVLRLLLRCAPLAQTPPLASTDRVDSIRGNAVPGRVRRLRRVRAAVPDGCAAHGRRSSRPARRALHRLRAVRRHLSEWCPSPLQEADAEQPDVPQTLVGSYLQIGRARGRFGASEIAGLKLRSIVDRLLS